MFVLLFILLLPAHRSSALCRWRSTAWSSFILPWRWAILLPTALRPCFIFHLKRQPQLLAPTAEVISSSWKVLLPVGRTCCRICSRHPVFHDIRCCLAGLVSRQSAQPGG